MPDATAGWLETIEAHLGDVDTAATDPLAYLAEGSYLLGVLMARREILNALELTNPAAEITERLRAHHDEFAEQLHAEWQRLTHT